MLRYEMVCIGAGPAGLAAAIEAARCGVQVVVFDENARPGGQLFKQIHKFFGSREHRAGERGFNIGQSLLDQARELGVEVVLDSVVLGIYDGGVLNINTGQEMVQARGQKVLIATGAAENMIPFEGWTLPGVIGAGAAQTVANLHGIKPGKRLLMLGAGNVGLVVSYQMLQAGCQVAAVIDAAPRIGGYGVHAAKVARQGVPFLMSHTVVKAHGEQAVEGVTIAQVDKSWQPVPGSEKRLEVDTICVAVGLNPMTQLCRMAGCKTVFSAPLGGHVPAHDINQETTARGYYVAGDVSGIEEASSAIIGGRIAGLAAANALGYLSDQDFEVQRGEQMKSMAGLRHGPFGEDRARAKVALDEFVEEARQ